jgi:hypothetical protein
MVGGGFPLGLSDPPWIIGRIKQDNRRSPLNLHADIIRLNSL